jgi:predicted nucleotidyltransferase
MRKLNGLVNENVLDCRTEGKNRVFSMKKSLQARSHVYNAERHKLLKLVGRYPEMGVIVDDILKKSREKLIVLFGSYAKLEATGSSDIDIYVENGKGAKDIGDIHSRISVKSGRFDPESRLIREIIKNHVILRGVEEFYEKTGFFE